MPEKGEISLHEVKLYRIFTASPSAWMTNKEVAAAAVSQKELLGCIHCG